jgi:hypothetical protein
MIELFQHSAHEGVHMDPYRREKTRRFGAREVLRAYFARPHALRSDGR